MCVGVGMCVSGGVITCICEGLDAWESILLVLTESLWLTFLGTLAMTHKQFAGMCVCECDM